MPKVVSPREVKRKIRSVQNLKKITKAMEMVSAAKLKKVQGRLLAIRPYSEKLRELLQDLSARAGDLDVPMLKPRAQVKRVAYVIFAGDKGLCGSYNANVLRLAQKTVFTDPGVKAPEAVLYTVGRKGGDLFKKRGKAPAGHWQALPADVGFKQVREITSAVIGAYKVGEVDEIYLIYSEFVNAVTFRPKVVKFLPFDAQGEMAKGADKKISRAEQKSDEGHEKKAVGEYIFEPGPADILAQLIPRYVEVLFYRILLEALASEHAARMSAMHNATDNASDMIGSLTLMYNKARQASITKELLDIVGGSEALKG